MPTRGRRATLILSMPNASSGADVLGSDHVPGRQSHFARPDILARLGNVFARSHRPHHLDGVLINGLGVLDHDHGVGVSRQHPAGVGHRRLTDFQGNVGRASHGHLAHQREPGRQSVAGPVGVRRAHAVAVHGGARKGGERFGRPNLRGNNPSQRVDGFHHAGPRRRSLRKETQEQDQRLLRRQHVEEFRHCGCDANYPRWDCQNTR